VGLGPPTGLAAADYYMTLESQKRGV